IEYALNTDEDLSYKQKDTLREITKRCNCQSQHYYTDNDIQLISSISSTQGLYNELKEKKSVLISNFKNDTASIGNWLDNIFCKSGIKKLNEFAIKRGLGSCNIPDSAKKSKADLFELMENQIINKYPDFSNNAAKSLQEKLQSKEAEINKQKDKDSEIKPEPNNWIVIIVWIILFLAIGVIGYYFGRRSIKSLEKKLSEFRAEIENTTNEIAELKNDNRVLRGNLQETQKMLSEDQNLPVNLRKEQVSNRDITMSEKAPHKFLYFGMPSPNGTFLADFSSSMPNAGQTIYELHPDETGRQGELFVWASPEAYTQAKGMVEKTLDPVCERNERTEQHFTKIVTDRPALLKLEGNIWSLVGDKVKIHFE
ncbi:MAG: hypothetical protein ACRC3B_09265, partial [Bacteroidia bacterium]